MLRQCKLVWVVFLLLLSPVMQKVTSKTLFTGKPDIPSEIMSLLHIQQIKQRILRGLNMTAAPSTRMLTPDSSKFKVRKPQVQETADRQPNVTMILSESSDDQKVDTVNFKFDSRLRTHVHNIEAALLVVQLRSYRDKPGQVVDLAPDVDVSEILTQIRRRRDEIKLDYQDPPEVALMLRNNTVGFEDDEVDNSHRNIPGKRRRGEIKQKLRRLKPRRVKVVVKVVDPVTRKKRRVAVEKVSVRKATNMAVAVPIDLLISAATSSNHTLTLQLTCKRCKRRVHIEKVFKTLKRKSNESERRRRLNPNRPFLFIKTGYNFASPSLGSDPFNQNLGAENGIVQNKKSKRDISEGLALISRYS